MTTLYSLTVTVSGNLSEADHARLDGQIRENVGPLDLLIESTVESALAETGYAGSLFDLSVKVA